MTTAAQTPPATTAGASRFRSLDGLRGIAAFAVLLHHCLLVSPTILDRPDAGPAWEWWARETPLHLAWLGDEAVIVFFVLSGFVLTLPMLPSPGGWRVYYVRRLIRLYLPTMVAVLAAAAMIVAVPRTFLPGQSSWVHGRDVAPAPWQLVRELLLATPDPHLNGVLWSLHYELLFSLALPAYLWFGLALRRWWLWKLVALVGASGLGSLVNVQALVMMPVFAVGVVLAVEQDAVGAFARRLRPWQWGVVFCAAVALLLAHTWGARGMVHFSMIAAAIIVVGVLHCRTAARVASTSPAQWLGRRSFSLYLVHEPIVATVAVVAAATAPWWPLAVAVPVSLLAAALMYRWVERPAQLLARRAGDRVSSR